MIKRTCDRCGKEMETGMFSPFTTYCVPDPNKAPYIPKIAAGITDPETGNVRQLDLCRECEEKLIEYIFGKEE